MDYKKKLSFRLKNVSILYNLLGIMILIGSKYDVCELFKN